MKTEDFNSAVENSVIAMESRETAETNPVNGSSIVPTGGSSQSNHPPRHGRSEQNLANDKEQFLFGVMVVKTQG